MNDLPKAPRNGKAFLISASTYDLLREAASRKTIFDNDDFSVAERQGKQMVRLRASTSDCPFGSVFKEEEVSKLKGGFVFGGSTNLDIEAIPLNMSSGTGDWLYLSVVFIANSADDILIPGVESIVSHSVGHGSLPDNVLPTTLDPEGTIHIPLGSYTSSEPPGGDPTFKASGCGNITIQHCPGVISFTRA